MLWNILDNSGYCPEFLANINKMNLLWFARIQINSMIMDNSARISGQKFQKYNPENRKFNIVQVKIQSSNQLGKCYERVMTHAKY